MEPLPLKQPPSTPLALQVIHVDGMWIAEGAAIGLVNGAETFEALTYRVWAIAPELAALNHLDIAPDRLRLCCAHEDSAPARRAAYWVVGEGCCRPLGDVLTLEAGAST